MGIALGLGAALSWGLADYFAAVASRQVGALRVVLFMHLAAMVPLTVVVLATDGLAGVSLGQLGVLFGMGAVGWLSYLAFYGALAIGQCRDLSEPEQPCSPRSGPSGSTMTPPERSGTTRSGTPHLAGWPCRFTGMMLPGEDPVPMLNGAA